MSWLPDRTFTLEPGPDLVVGGRTPVPVLGGVVPYINLDNAASTPPLRAVADGVRRFEEWYASVHRGMGFKSRLATEAYEHARHLVARFVRMNPESNAVIFVRNTTEAVNKLARRYPFRPGDVVLSTEMEHHSNDLPWRRQAAVDYVRADERGTLLLDDLEEKLRRYQGRVRLVTVTGASNVTGALNPIHRIAALAHRFGAQIMVDAAQLAPHRPVDARPDGDPEHLDFVALSGHKMYAPYGAGALIGPKALFAEGEPDLVGGGVVDVVTHREVLWTGLPDREEAGSPNVIGAVALGLAIVALERIGWDRLVEHEANLTNYALHQLQSVPGLRIYGGADRLGPDGRVGVITFNLSDIPHSLVAAILAYEGGIGVRNGCFCAHPFMLKLLHVDPQDVLQYRDEIRRGNKSRVPGMVRASFGLYNTREDVDTLVTWLKRIAAGDYRGHYHIDPAHGDYQPEEPVPSLDAYFSWGGDAPAPTAATGSIPHT